LIFLTATLWAVSSFAASLSLIWRSASATSLCALVPVIPAWSYILAAGPYLLITSSGVRSGSTFLLVGDAAITGSGVVSSWAPATREGITFITLFGLIFLTATLWSVSSFEASLSLIWRSASATKTCGSVSFISLLSYISANGAYLEIISSGVKPTTLLLRFALSRFALSERTLFFTSAAKVSVNSSICDANSFLFAVISSSLSWASRELLGCPVSPSKSFNREYAAS